MHVFFTGFIILYFGGHLMENSTCTRICKYGRDHLMLIICCVVGKGHRRRHTVFLGGNSVTTFLGDGHD